VSCKENSWIPVPANQAALSEQQKQIPNRQGTFNDGYVALL
jgi:hypothetical protein